MNIHFKQIFLDFIQKYFFEKINQEKILNNY
jgi:hypothetical protein